MKPINYVILLAFLMTLGSCATNVKFPVSPIAPAAEGAATIKKDKNQNYVIELTVKYLTNPDRLIPPKQFYVVWIETDDGTNMNLGMLVSNNTNKASLRSVTSSRPSKIFITAEDAGDANIPSNQEVFRTEYILLK